MVRKRIGKVFSPKIVVALLAAVISVSNVQSVNAVVNDNADSVSTEGSASEDKILDGETAWVDGKQVTGNIETLNPDPAHSDLTDGKSGENGVPSTGFNYEISSVGKNGQTIMIPKHMYTGKDDGKTFNIYIPSIKDLIANSDSTDTYMQEKTVKASEEGLVIEPDTGFVGMTKLTIDPDGKLVSKNIRKGVEIFGVKGSIADLVKADIGTKATTADEKTANNFDYKVDSIGANGQTITIPEAKYSGDDGFKIYIPSVLDLSDPNNLNPTTIPLQDRILTVAEIKADPTTTTVVTKTDPNAVGLKSVTIPSLKDLTPGNATAGQIVSGKKAWVNGAEITGTATAESHTVQSSKSVSPNFSSGNVTVSPDSPNNVMSSVVIQKDANLKPENIANGVTIFGVTGSLNSSSSPGANGYTMKTISGTNSVTMTDDGIAVFVITAKCTDSSSSESAYCNVDPYINDVLQKHIKTNNLGGNTVTILYSNNIKSGDVISVKTSKYADNASSWSITKVTAYVACGA